MYRGAPRSTWQVFTLLLMLAAAPALAATPEIHPQVTDVTVLVTDFATHKPVFQARLTLEFRDSQSRRHKMISFSAKTDLRGMYKFTFIPMEPVLLFVTDPNHQSFGRRFQITKANQELRVALRKPEPLR
ncbi:MAG: hypothetical protein ACRD3O_12865 [Terriglobia bacterium]